MKSYIKSYFLLFLITLLFASCQDEAVQIINPDEQETITANSSLSNLMLRTSANAVSEDNIIDNSNCFSVELPVTVIVGNITITIENEEGFDELQELLENFEDEIPAFVFPITIISADYTETVIENQDQLEALLEECIEDNDVIECVDFVYPISFSVLNSEFVIIDTVTIESNEALHDFLENLEDNNTNLVALNFPVTLEYASGETVTVNSNTELSDAISSVDEDCDDDDFENCDLDEIRQSLKECKWEIEAYSSFPEFEGFELEFNEDFTFDIIIDDNQVLSEGNTWELVEEGDYVYLVLATDFEDFAGNWKIVQCGDDEFYLTKDDQSMLIEQYCETDLNCSAEDLSNDLVECFWFAATSLLSNQDNKFVFTEDGTVKVYINNEFIEIGTWNISVEANELTLVLSLTGNYEVLSGNWKVTECHEGFYGLSNNDNILHLEQECFDVGCTEDQVEGYLETCIWNAVNVSGSQELTNYDLEFMGETELTITIPGAEPITATYSVLSMTDGVYLDISGVNASDIQAINGYRKLIECDEDRLKFENDQGFIILERNCNVQPSPFDCFGDIEFDIEECANDAGEALFNLDAGTVELVTCSNYTYSFHFSQADAESNNSPILDTQNYLSTSGEVYLRIEDLNNEFQVYPVYLNAVDCNPFGCFTSFDALIELCDEDNDGFETFDLTIAFANCTPSADVVTYHTSLADADGNLNPIANPESFVNTSEPQIIYVRVEINSAHEVFELQLKLEDCSNGSCTEDDVDGILMNCQWKVTEYNGSDDLSIYQLEFLNQEVIITNLNTNETQTGFWATYTNGNNQVVVQFENIFDGAIENITGNWTVVECTGEQLIFHRDNDQMTLDKLCD